MLILLLLNSFFQIYLSFSNQILFLSPSLNILVFAGIQKLMRSYKNHRSPAYFKTQEENQAMTNTKIIVNKKSKGLKNNNVELNRTIEANFCESSKKFVKIASINLDSIRKLTRLYKLKTEHNTKNNCYFTQNCLINRVRIINLFRQGSFGRIYRAILKNVDSSIQVAVKKIIIDESHTSREDQFAKILKNPYVVHFIGTYFTNQYQTQHPNIHEEDTNFLKTEQNKVETLDPKHKFQKRCLNIVMSKYGNSLAQVLKMQNLTNLKIKIFLYQMVRSLVYIHALNICHRDIKPQNFVFKQNRVLLCDFGAAKYMDLGLGQKSVTYIFSREYRAPELIFDYQHYDKSVDIWALGCVAAEMVLKKPLFQSSNNIDHLLKILKVLGSPKWQLISFCKDRNPKIPEIVGSGLKQALSENCDTLLVKLISKMLRIEPKQRISAVEALADPYFDDIRDQSFYRSNLRNNNLPNFFDFSKRELFGKQQYQNKLVPFWIKQHCKRFQIDLKNYHF